MKTLICKNITKKFDEEIILDSLSFSLKSGTLTSIIGSNGSGKSTLLNVLSGITPFDSGSLFLKNSKKLLKISPLFLFSYKITRTFQEIRIFPQMTIFENVIITLQKRSVFSSFFEETTKEQEKKVNTLLRKTHLFKKRNELANTLSFGQKRLLEIARMLCMDADIYILDEPFSGLFSETIQEISNIFKELQDSGKTMLLIEHNSNIVHSLSDEIYILHKGKLQQQKIPKK